MARGKQTFFKCGKNSCNVNFHQLVHSLVYTKQKCNALQDQSQDLLVRIQGKELDTNLSTRYLCINIDGSFDLKDHIKAIHSDVSRAIRFLRIARNIIPPDA